jgi:hypothetical protein
LNILTGILFLPGDLALTTLGQIPKVPFVSSTHSATAVSRTVFDLHIPDTGSPLPYLGYVEVSISVTFQSDNMMVLLLVVPETDYSKSVPVVIGTNILRPIKSSVSDSHVKVPHNSFTSFNPQIILLGFRYTTLVVILNILTGILFLSGDLTLTTLGQTPKVPFVSSSALDAGVNLVKSTNKRPIKVGPMSI